MTILVVSAHPDDELLGCGGTIARLARENNEVYAMILGTGRPTVEQIRKAENILGITTYTFGFPDNRFDTSPLLDVIRLVEDMIYKLQPSIIFTHHPSDLNIDHVLTHRAVITATRPVNQCPVEDILTFETPSSTEWSFSQFGSFNPNVFYDISSTIGIKIEAMRAYESEIRNFPHPRSEGTLSAIARRWGSVVGVPFAEAFQLVRSIR